MKYKEDQSVNAISQPGMTSAALALAACHM